MMRKIKFRAWIESENRMERTIEISPFHVGDCDRFRWSHGEVEIMQYTGLKDKNDVAIYEGDIIFVPAWNRKYKIVFEAGMFRARNLSHGWNENKVSLATFKGEINCEVIGNIYEQPDLLEDNQ